MSSSGIPFMLRRRYEIIIHIVVWLYIFLAPILFKPDERPLDLAHDAHQFILPLCWFITFYANYFWLAPHYFQKKKYTRYLLLATLVILLTMMVRPIVGMLFPHLYPTPPADGAVGPVSATDFFEWKKLVHDFSMYALSSFAALFARVARKWQNMEMDLQKAKLQKTEAEIKNLKYQINPHFLLNVLNNIYALIAIDTEKAQVAVRELSKMMRYLLSKFDQPTVPLSQEMEFIETYVNLMRLRITNNVDLQFSIDVPESNSMEMAPMILISLVENAFKHGISPVEKSFIHINIKARNNKVHFSCANSNFPKTADDKTPSGVGLKLVEKRLEISYPGNYEYKNGLSKDGKTFTTTIDINL